MRYVIIGTSAAGLAAAETLRAWDRQGRVTLVSDEAHLPYSRPLLTYLLGQEINPEKIFLRAADYFAKWGLTPRLGAAVVQVDPAARTVRLADGDLLPYDRLLIASGANPRVPRIPGAHLPGVFTLRHLADLQRLEAGLTPGGTVVVVGAGAVGLKAAEALASRGLQVRLLEQEARPLSRLLDPVAEDLLIAALKEKHLDLYLQSWPEAILEEKGRVAGVALNGHRELKAQAVLFAVGVEPRVDFLADTGIASPEGIRVDPFMHTAAPDIYAAGDCCLPHHLLTGQPAAFYIWPAAVAQGQVAGANLAGAGRRYDGILPQNSISLKGFRLITGGHLNPDTGDGEVFTQLDRQHRRYRRLVFQDGRLVGVTLVGQVSEAGLYFHLISRKLPVAQLPIDLRSPDFQPGRLWG